MTFDQVYAQCKLVVETSEIEKKRLESQKNLSDYEICRISDLEKDIEFYSTIAKACEKQIAKKPIEGATFKHIGKCPDCRQVISTRSASNNCQYCGQKIDWGKDE